jgi:hypothetical protein
VRSQRDLLIGLALGIAVCAAWSAEHVRAQQPTAAAARGERPTDDTIAGAVEAVKADPNLATETTIKTLRWRDSSQPRSAGRFGWLRWLGSLFGWMEQSARVLVWGGVLVLVGLLVRFLIAVSQRRVGGGAEPLFIAPTHVGDLDIRPETLPQDIGGAARALWDRGDHRPALALLYRGLLSRLVHVHQLEIRDSSTEGDCLTLSATHLSRPRFEYASQLVTVWQRAVYGRESVQDPVVHHLCDRFAAVLDRRSDGASVAGVGTP